MAVCPAPIARTFRDVDPEERQRLWQGRTADGDRSVRRSPRQCGLLSRLRNGHGGWSVLRRSRQTVGRCGRPPRPRIAERFIAAYGAGLNREAARNEVTRADPRELYTMIKRYFEAGESGAVPVLS